MKCLCSHVRHAPIQFTRLCFVPQDEQKAAAMAGLSEEGPPKADTEEVRTDVWGMEVVGRGGGGGWRW